MGGCSQERSYGGLGGGVRTNRPTDPLQLEVRLYSTSACTRVIRLNGVSSSRAYPEMPLGLEAQTCSLDSIMHYTRV